MQSKVETRVGIFVLAALAVFVYMGFRVDAFRFDRSNYYGYTLHFDNASGLSRKADVKIAGVKVGWVDEVELSQQDDGQNKVRAHVKVLRNYALYSDAHGVVHQDGMLGPRFVEIMPGDPLLSRLEPDSSIGRPGESPVSLDELVKQFSGIAQNIQEVSTSLKEAMGGVEGREQLCATMNNLHTISQRFVSFSDVLDRDLGQVTTDMSASARALEEAALQARDGMRCMTSVAEKVDEGKGLIGQLVHDEETFTEFKGAVHGLKNYMTKMDQMQIVFDSHFESMHRPAENYQYEDSKGYFDVRIHPSEDYFYLIQVATSEKGFMWRDEVHPTYCDLEGRNVDPTMLNITDRERLEFTFRRKREYFKRNALKFGLQFGKIFGDVALRMGVIEGSAGLGVDVDIPFRTDHFRWVTSIEVFDMAGQNRKDDRRPHVKWINRMFFLNNLYAVFGADDFASKRNASCFFGAGVRFGDDDVKYLLSAVSGAGGALIAQQ